MRGGPILYVLDGYPLPHAQSLNRELDALARNALSIRAVTTVLLPDHLWSREARACAVAVDAMPRLRHPANDAQLLRFAARRPRRAWRAAGAFARSIGKLDANFLQLRRAFWLADYSRRVGASVLHAGSAHMSAILAQTAGLLAGLPYTISAHADDVFSKEPGLSARLGGATVVFACNPAAAAAARQSGARSVVEFRHPLPERWLGRPDVTARPRTGRPLRLVFAARLVSIKGFDTLISAFARAVGRGADLELDVAGAGPEGVLVAGLPPATRARVRRHGWLDGASYERVLESADVLVFPGRTTANGASDGIPNAVLEAFAFGVPVVATLAGSIADALGAAADAAGCVERGTVVQGRTEGERIAALADLLARFDPAAPEIVAAAARAQRWVRATFDPASCVRPLIERFGALSAR